MLEAVASLFVGRPLSALAVAVLMFAAGTALRAGRRAKAARWWLIAGGCWLAYAAWEYLVVTRTPEANIRVDLLLIYPILAAVSLWAVFRTVRPPG